MKDRFFSAYTAVFSTHTRRCESAVLHNTPVEAEPGPSAVSYSALLRVFAAATLTKKFRSPDPLTRGDVRGSHPLARVSERWHVLGMPTIFRGGP